MSSVRSRVLPETTASEALGAAYGWWTPHFASLSPLGLDRTPDFSRMAEQAQEAGQAALRHWRALAELQIRTADEAYRLASSHADRRREALTRMMETLWPAQAGARPGEEAARV